LSVTHQTLQDHINKTFSRTDWSQFLIPLHHVDVFDFMLGSLGKEHAGCDSDELTLIMDSATQQEGDVLNRLGHASHIHITGIYNGDLDQVESIRGIDVPHTQRFFILFSPSASVFLFKAPSIEKTDTEDTIKGYWSFHNEAITSIAEFILKGTALVTPAMISEDTPCVITPLTMNLMKQVGDFIVESQRNAIIQKNDTTLILDILKSLSVRRSTHELLYIFADKIAASIPTNRCSVVRIWEDSTEAHVLASHEDSSVDDMIIQLSKYPEIIHTMQCKQTTAINDIENDPITKPVSDQLSTMGITSIIVIPIVMENPKVGTFLLRAIRKDGAFSQREIDFCRIASETASNAIERSDLFDTIHQTNRTLERLATTDDLTGLNNRRFFMERMEEELARSLRYKTPLSCVLLDVDNFKSVNDTYGHLQGDLILKEVSRRTVMSIRTNDVVARYGGEELIILLPQTDQVGAKTNATRLLESIPSRPYKGIPKDERITVSMGLVTLTEGEEKTADELIKAADDALYEAKRTGKNKLVIA